jgi:hypothetical protein
LSEGPIRTYADFWPTYVNAHRHPMTRTLHFIGTTLAILCLVAGLIGYSLWLLPAAPFIAYGFAWAAHFWMEKNRPATFGHPFMSLISDFRMYGLMWLGRMDGEVARLERDKL